VKGRLTGAVTFPPWSVAWKWTVCGPSHMTSGTAPAQGVQPWLPGVPETRGRGTDRCAGLGRLPEAGTLGQLLEPLSLPSGAGSDGTDRCQ
jgi:hypothetical protein